MNSYFYLETTLPVDLEAKIEALAFSDYACQGVEEFSIDEPRVDEILGERSYSGGDLPISVIQEVESTVQGNSCRKKFYFESEQATNNFKFFLKDKHALNSEVYSAQVEDWNEEWKKSYKPIVISEQFQVTPAWDKETTVDNDVKHVFIYPGMGFGTGGHETTFLCLKLLDQIKETLPKYSYCLDFGCGSGILGIALRVLMPSKTDMYDIDEDALLNCKQNIEINDLDQKEFKLLLPSDRKQIEKKYDLVFANILQNVLLAENDYLARSVKTGGYLILSGLLKGQEQEVIDLLTVTNTNLEYQETLTKGDWVAVLMRMQ